jgi:uncharacterized membrane protein
MNLVARAKAILMTPKQAWAVIDGEALNVSALLTGYVIPLALIGPIASFIGLSILGNGFFRLGFGMGISRAIVAFVLAIVGVFVLAWVINALAPSFGAKQEMPQAIKLAAYSMTAAWVAGIFYLIPTLSILALIGALYSLYLFYVGLPILMKSPEDKTPAYAIAVIVACIVVFFIIGQITSRMMYM